MLYKIGLCSLLVCICHGVLAQNEIDTLLRAVAENNKTLAAGEDYRQAQRLGHRTGLMPQDPMVEYDFLNGRPASAGDQTDIVVTQAFDFPTAYVHRSRIADARGEQLLFRENALRRDVLLSAKLTGLEVIYLNKRITVLEHRLKTAQRMLTGYQERFARQDVSVIDLNKAKLQALKVGKELDLSRSERTRALEKLQELNGGKPVALPDTLYPAAPEVPAFSVLEPLIEANDPRIQLLKSEEEVASMQVKLSKALALPRFEAGYHYQSILQQRFSGIHLGVSIPLWERSNTVRQQRAETVFRRAQVEEHLTGHFHETKRLYERYQLLQQNLQAYRETLSGIGSEQVLQRSLELGELSFIEYALEIEYLYDSEDTYLQLEKEYYQALARLYQYEL